MKLLFESPLPQRPRRGRRETDIAAYRKILKCDPCSYCGDPAGGIDHVDPRARNGANDVIENITACCLWCNSQKQRYHWLYWMSDARAEPLVPHKAVYSGLRNSFRLEGRPHLRAGDLWSRWGTA